MRTFVLAALIVAVAACSGGGMGASASTTPGASDDAASPPASPDFGAIEHPTGPTDVVLRFEEGGGFVMAAFLATQAPAFTLYGDGRIVFRNAAGEPLEPIGSVYPNVPFRTAKLSEEQVQDLLTFATSIAPADFVSNGDPNAFGLPARVLSAEDVEALGIAPFEGGFQGLPLIGPDDGKFYTFSLHSLLPDETG